MRNLLLVGVGGFIGSAAVEAVIAEYKRRFAHHSVMRVITPARVSF